MEEINLKKQKISYEGKSVEGTNEFTVKGEYLIPDTHPDVYKILMVEVKPKINNTESFTDKVFVEGEILYTVIYTSKDEEKDNTYNVSYSDKFNLYIETFGMKKESLYNVTTDVIRIDSLVLNERKISVDGVLKFTSIANEVLDVDVVYDLEGQNDIQLLMKDIKICELKGTFTEELSNETIINIPLDKVSISKILVCDSYIYKTECKLLEGKIVYNAYCKIKVLYKGVGSDELCYLEQDIYLTKEIDSEDVSEDMISVDNWSMIGFEYMIDEDESGESRIINIYLNLKCDLKVMHNNIISAIDDAYSKTSFINLVKNSYKINNIEDYNSTDIIVKDNVEVEEVPTNIVYSTGRCFITNKKIIEGKVIVDGVVKAEVIYKTNSKENEFVSFKHEIPFSTSIENENIKIDMDVIGKCNLESIDAYIEAKTIGIKVIVNVKTQLSSEVRKDILVDIYRTQEEAPEKDCSVIIYIVGEDDTLWSIAKKYCVAIEDICRINDLNQDDDIFGQKLLIPLKAIF